MDQRPSDNASHPTPTSAPAAAPARHGPTPRLFVAVGGILLVLLLVNVWVSALNLGPLTVVFGLGIAVVKALLVAVFFMELRYRSGLMRVFAAAGVFWLGIMITLTLTDFVSRNWV